MKEVNQHYDIKVHAQQWWNNHAPKALIPGIPPLTLALSLRERGRKLPHPNPLPRERGQIERGLALPPLPWGEGRGEGKWFPHTSDKKKPTPKGWFCETSNREINAAETERSA